LQKSPESFWVLPHADEWPAAVPSMSFDSDRSDVEVHGVREEEEQVQQPTRKRKAGGNSSAAEAPAQKKAKKAAEVSRVGRVVAVPAWKFGRDWADKNFHRPMSAMLIGDITGVNPRRTNGKFVCLMREDKGYKLHLTQSEVDEYTLTGRIAAEAKDTPWKHGEELND